MHCCTQMNFFLSEGKVDIGYDKIMREYYIFIKNSKSVQLMYYCPWCGLKLPLPLRSKLFDTLEREYGIETTAAEFRNRVDVPQEFYTDEWWKKRGL